MNDIIKFYEEKTGDKCPDNQIAYSEWYIRYVRWLEKKIREYIMKDNTLNDLFN
jgi:hypothetical protein